MKPLKLIILSLVFPLVFHAQKSLTGLWIGTLDNDSATVRKNQAFEIALTEYRGKVYGYSRMTFTVNDTLYHIVKRVKGTIDGEICEVKDDEIITHNFPRKPDKGVKLISTFRRNQQDSIWKLDGDWKTTESKRHAYYSISGKISLSSEPDISKSKLFPHLEELDIAKNVEFYAVAKKKEAEANNVALQAIAKKETNQTKQTEPEKKQPTQQQSQAASITQPVNTEKPLTTDEALATTTLKKSNAPANSLPTQNKQVDHAIAKPETKNQPGVKPVLTTQTTQEDLAATTLKKSGTPANSLPAQNRAINNNDLAKPEIKPQAAAIKINEPITTVESKSVDQSLIAKAEPGKKTIQNELPALPVNSSAAAAFIAERKLAAPQVVEFKSDSLVIKLYDNGEIDGDTVSVLLNGEILMAKQGLKASAIKKTIYIQPGDDEMTLVLYAENLGKYPPNTGLLVVNDGEDTYQLRFSADLQQNASVVFRRKK